MGNSLIVREPVGVVGAITPWNYPLHQIAAKVAPALAAGCTVVLKPSEVAPLNAFVLAEILDEVGPAPGGVQPGLGVRTGRGRGDRRASRGRHGVLHRVDPGGKRVAELAAAPSSAWRSSWGQVGQRHPGRRRPRPVAVPDGVSKCFLNSGQTCSALTRMLVPRDRLAEAEVLAVRPAETFTPGTPFDPQSRIGPLVSAIQRDRVRSYIERGVDEGARLLTGGPEPPEGLDTGFFVRPTVFSGVTPDMTIAREEIFGPVLSIIPYDTEDEAVSIANGTPYGLSGGVWSADPARAEGVARRLRTGQVEVNGGRFNPLAPFGGYRQSGNGREYGAFGLEEFLEVKSLQR